MSLGNAFPVRSTIPDTVKVQGVWTGGGAAANCTHADADWNRGIASVVYTATGIYTITFLDCGQQIVDYSLQVENATGVDPVVGKLVAGSFSSSAKTVSVEFGATLADLLTTDKLHITFEFAKNGP